MRRNFSAYHLVKFAMRSGSDVNKSSVKRFTGQETLHASQKIKQHVIKSISGAVLTGLASKSTGHFSFHFSLILGSYVADLADLEDLAFAERVGHTNTPGYTCFSMKDRLPRINLG